jgi:hypothetical protein
MTEMPTVAPMPTLMYPKKPTWSDKYWPQVSDTAGRPTIIAAVGAGFVAASAIPLDRPGIGWFVAASGIAVALVVVANRHRGHLRLPWLLAALALMAVGAVRAADWLFVLCVLAACATGSLAVTGGKSLRALFFGAHSVGIAAFRALPWARADLRTLRGTGGSGPRIGRSVLIAVVLFVVFGSLLASADRGFAELIWSAIPDVDAPRVIQWVYLFGVVGFATLGGAFLLANPARVDDAPRMSVRKVRLSEWVLPVGVLVGLFGAFVAVQLTVLFGGSSYVLSTAGMTYAQYARSGFWQLLAVTTLTLGVLGVAARVAPAETAAERLWLRIMLGALAMLTLVIVISAITRLWTYQQIYGFTVLRLLVGVCEIWLGLVYVLVLAAGVRLSAAWLPRTVIASAIGLLLGLAVLDPERFVADRNVARFAESGKIDLVYLGHLSSDVVPALDALPEPQRTCALFRQAQNMTRDFGDQDTAMGWNLARAKARATLESVQGYCDLPSTP